MKIIPITATAAEKLKRLAKTLRKQTGTSLAKALDSVALDQGYGSWKHLTLCLTETQSAGASPLTLPQSLLGYLEDEARANPSIAGTSGLAFQSGLVFALDVKDAETFNPGDNVVECGEAWMFAASDVWRLFVNAKDDETGKSLVDVYSGDALLQRAQDFYMDVRLFKYTGPDTPETLTEAFARVLRRSFFPPMYIWLKGKFIDMDDVRQSLVDGEVTYATAAVGEQASAAGHLVQIANTSLPKSTPSDKVIMELDIERIDAGLYGFRLSFGPNEMDTGAGYSSIQEAIESAAAVTGPIRGYVVSYQGVVVGTYPLTMLQSSAAKVAQEAVDTVSALRD
ncbi:hypothetical protein [Aquabacterium sp.]|uniref:hypothetical protein n=1 Tax=Aquabacterium sp. TaxID=1872578 RepID=UPI0024897465|nr:hypothetical protein [Aquabacterium sp.]MDI1258261.1 hypothetical protein [Aquabacterium sp.]